MLFRMLSILLFVILYNVHVNCEFFTSIGHLNTLVESVDGVTRDLETYLIKEYEFFEKARKMLGDFRKIAHDSNKDPEHFIGNPVNSFLLIKKLTLDLQEFFDVMFNEERLKALVEIIRKKHMLPSNEDYEGTGVGLHRLEDTYKLTPREISSGNLSKTFPSRPLTAFECYELGRIAYNNKDYYHTINWMTQALKQVESERNPTVNKFLVLDYLSYATYMQGNIQHAIEITQEMLKNDSTNPRTIANLEFYQDTLKEQLTKRRGDNGIGYSVEDDPLIFKNPRPKPHYNERDLYETLCRGETFEIPPKRLKSLKCRYINHNPFLIIGPIKQEQLYDNPAIWLYHDVITNEQINAMKILASPKLKRAIVRSPVTGEYETADYRISKSGWLHDNEHPQLGYMTKLVQAITNLTLTTAEEWQIANYGIGGQYEPHFDFARKSDPGNAFESSIGNRIATWLFYLEVPERGGATVFPSIRYAVKPIRRSAAFWYNLHPSGDGDYNTRHAACPVLFGTKWVSNKWIHVVGQEFRRPCSLTREYSEDMYY